MNDLILSSISVAELELLIQRVVRKAMTERLESTNTCEPSDRCDFPEAAELLNISKSQLYKLTCSKKIPFQKFGKRLVFKRKELFAWIEEMTVSVTPDDDVVTKLLSNSAKRKLRY